MGGGGVAECGVGWREGSECACERGWAGGGGDGTRQAPAPRSNPSRINAQLARYAYIKLARERRPALSSTASPRARSASFGTFGRGADHFPAVSPNIPPLQMKDGLASYTMHAPFFKKSPELARTLLRSAAFAAAAFELASAAAANRRTDAANFRGGAAADMSLMPRPRRLPAAGSLVCAGGRERGRSEGENHVDFLSRDPQLRSRPKAAGTRGQAPLALMCKKNRFRPLPQKKVLGGPTSALPWGCCTHN